jgi:hypothetical protein
MNDRELLELAANAAGIEYDGIAAKDIYSGHYVIPWNPLTNDGDALRLAVKLMIDPSFGTDDVYASNGIEETASFELYGNDKYAATRRAIVRAAAEIGKAKELE